MLGVLKHALKVARHRLGGKGQQGRASAPDALCQGLHSVCWMLKHPWEGSKGKLGSLCLLQCTALTFQFPTLAGHNENPVPFP